MPLKNVLDLSKAFETASGVSLAMGCIVAKKDFVQQNKAAIDAFLAEYQKSVEYTCLLYTYYAAEEL